jgi:peroxiredoxin
MTTSPQTQSPAAVGQLAPDFRLPSVQGTAVSLSHYRNQANLILWFSRGLTCNFCRSYMQSFETEYDNLRAQGIEVIQIAPNLLESAQRFFTKSPPFPFVCDPEKRLYALYGLGDRGVLAAAQMTVVSFATAAREGEFGSNVRGSLLDIANRNFLRRLHHHALTAIDQGIFIIDQQGIIRYRLTVGAIEPIPNGAELLKLCQTVCT